MAETEVGGIRYCVDCNAPLPEIKRKRFCDACLKRHKKTRAKELAEERKTVKAAKIRNQNKPAESLSKIAKEAAERGMSYGRYIAIHKAERKENA